MASIKHRVGIKGSLQDIYESLHHPDKIDGWWPTTASGTPKVGERIQLDFPGYTSHVWKIIELADNEVIHLQCKEGPEPWMGSELRFELNDGESQVFVTLEHSKVDPEDEAYLYFSTKWPTFLLSLKDLHETGTGRPYPNDIRINHE